MNSDLFFIIYVAKLAIIAFIPCLIDAKELPRITSVRTNKTTVLGRDTSLTCNVENLQNFKVAWLRVDTQTVLTIDQHVVTKNHRVGIMRSEPGAWTLTLRDTRRSDAGQYMCQLNTDPMTTRTYQLNVFVPPNIVDFNTSGEVVVEKGDNVTLHCTATGTPQPSITWRREDTRLLDRENVFKTEGVWLNLTSVDCDMNGAILCIASNGVPPSVSKRILLHVLCKPRVEAVQKLVGVYFGGTASLMCRFNGYPPPDIYWSDVYRKSLAEGLKYKTKTIINTYQYTSRLIINNISRGDVGAYHCHAENTLGADNDTVTLYTLATTTAAAALTIRIVTSSDPATDVSTNPSKEDFHLVKTLGEYSNSNNALILSHHQLQSTTSTS